MQQTKVKYSICGEDVYSFDKTSFYDGQHHGPARHDIVREEWLAKRWVGGGGDAANIQSLSHRRPN